MITLVLKIADFFILDYTTAHALIIEHIVLSIYRLEEIIDN